MCGSYYYYYNIEQFSLFFFLLFLSIAGTEFDIASLLCRKRGLSFLFFSSPLSLSLSPHPSLSHIPPFPFFSSDPTEDDDEKYSTIHSMWERAFPTPSVLVHLPSSLLFLSFLSSFLPFLTSTSPLFFFLVFLSPPPRFPLLQQKYNQKWKKIISESTSSPSSSPLSLFGLCDVEVIFPSFSFLSLFPLSS